MKARSDRGMALLIVLGVVVLLSMMVAVAMSWSKNDRSRGAKLVHNLTVQELAESTLQFGRGYYAQNYALWNTHLAYFVSARTVAQVKTDHPELIAPPPMSWPAGELPEESLVSSRNGLSSLAQALPRTLLVRTG